MLLKASEMVPGKLYQSAHHYGKRPLVNEEGELVYSLVPGEIVCLLSKATMSDGACRTMLLTLSGIVGGCWNLHFSRNFAAADTTGGY